MPKLPAPNDGTEQRTLAILYAAKSTEDKHDSIPTQLEDARAKAEQEGWEVYDEDSDEGFSAYSGNRGPGLERAKRKAADAARLSGRTAMLVAQHSDRIARGAGDKPGAAHSLVEIWHAMRRQDVHLRAVQNDSELSDPVLVAVAAKRDHEDSRRKSEATRAGKRRRFEKGKTLGGRVHDGYRKGAPDEERDGRVTYLRERDPERAPLIERMYGLVESGQTFGDVARRYNAEGLRTRPSRRWPNGNRWTTRAVREIVTNPYYAGWIEAYGERVEGNHPRLIDRDRWEAIQASLTRLDPAALQRRKGGRRPAEHYMLRGVAFCLYCGDSMYTRRYASGRAYVCMNVREATGVCHAPPVPAEQLERQVIRHLDDLIPHVEGWIGERVAERRGERQALQHALDAQRSHERHLHRDVELLRADYRRHLRAGAETKADLALAEMERVSADTEAQTRVVEEAAARLAEWEVEPSTTDAALDFYKEVTDLIRGRIRSARSVIDLSAALTELLAGIWTGVNDHGCLGAKFVLREPCELAPGMEATGLRVVAPLGIAERAPKWLPTEPDGSRSCTSSR